MPRDARGIGIGTRSSAIVVRSSTREEQNLATVVCAHRVGAWAVLRPGEVLRSAEVGGRWPGWRRMVGVTYFVYNCRLLY